MKISISKLFIPALWAIVLAALLASATIALGLEVVCVEGTSMEPRLPPRSRLLVLTAPGFRRLIRAGDLVLASPPSHALQGPATIVKRVTLIRRDNHRRFYELMGDNSANSRDSRSYGLVPAERLRGLVILVLSRGRLSCEHATWRELNPPGNSRLPES